MNRTEERFKAFRPKLFFRNRGNYNKYGTAQHVEDMSIEEMEKEKEKMYYINKISQRNVNYGVILKSGKSAILLSAYNTVYCKGAHYHEEDIDGLWKKLFEFMQCNCGWR